MYESNIIGIIIIIKFSLFSVYDVIMFVFILIVFIIMGYFYIMVKVMSILGGRFKDIYIWKDIYSFIVCLIIYFFKGLFKVIDILFFKV